MVAVSAGTRTLDRVRREASRNGYQREQLTAPTFTGMNTDRNSKKNSREPQPLAEILGSFYANKSVAKQLLLPQLIENWELVVGAVVAEHTKPKMLVDDVLQVSADSTVWAAQLSALGQILVNKINVITGSSAVRRIQVSGPKANVPNYGPRTVKGRVGYRDTFG